LRKQRQRAETEAADETAATEATAAADETAATVAADETAATEATEAAEAAEAMEATGHSFIHSIRSAPRRPHQAEVFSMNRRAMRTSATIITSQPAARGEKGQAAYRGA
jgi:hypothetical protein